MADDAYEAVPYDDRPVAETHPDRLYVAGRLAGLDAARPESARILELGCAHGVNLIPIAFHLPQTVSLGIDLSPGQIARGQARLSELGLDNLELCAADVSTLELGDARFDYIVAHGLYSWVPDPVRAAILQLCARHLAPGGLAYVSYNALPAWSVRGAIGHALRRIAGHLDDPAAQIRACRAALERLADVEPLAGTAEGALLAHEIADLHDKPDAYLLHEYLVPTVRAFYLDEFVARARAAGLAYVGDVAPTGLDPAVEQGARAQLRALVDDPIGVEQLADIMTFRQFRASLLARAEDAAVATPVPLAELVRVGHVAAPPDDEAPPWRAGLGARWPADRSFPALAAEIDDPDPAAVVAAAIAGGLAELRPRALPIAARVAAMPVVSDLSRFEARHLSFVTTPKHAYAPLDAFHAALVRVCDGARDRDDLVEALIAEIGAGRLEVAGGGTPSDDALRAALPNMVSEALARLRLAGLLVRQSPSRSSRS